MSCPKIPAGMNLTEYCYEYPDCDSDDCKNIRNYHAGYIIEGSIAGSDFGGFEELLRTIHRETGLLPEKLITFADGLRMQGHHELALIAYQFTPQLLSGTDPKQMQLLSTALQGQARTFEALQRLSEAESAFVTSQQVAMMSAQMQ